MAVSQFFYGFGSLLVSHESFAFSSTPLEVGNVGRRFESRFGKGRQIQIVFVDSDFRALVMSSLSGTAFMNEVNTIVASTRGSSSRAFYFVQDR